MQYIKNFNEFIFENNLTSIVKPIETGVVILISNPNPHDNMRRVFISLIDTIQEKNNTFKVKLLPVFYMLKQHPPDLIMPEKMPYLSEKDIKDLFNMNSMFIFLKDDKTPSWKTSTEKNRFRFFREEQALLKDLPNRYKDVIYPFTTIKNLKNYTMENFQLADKYYFKTNKLNKEEQNVILW